MPKQFFTTMIASGGLAGETFNINAGPAETGVIDILLSAASITSTLQANAPISLTSTGVLTGNRILDISLIEDDGRIFMLSVQNSDINTFTLTVVSSSTINGAADLDILSTGDYYFTHVGSGSWRVFNSTLPSEKSNLELEMEFKVTQLTNFKELLYTGNKLTTVNIYEDNTMTVQLFGKALSYTGNNLTSTVLTRIRDSATLTKTLSYTGNKLTSVETT